MGIIISFCIGIILITVSNDIGDILQFIWVSPTLDVLGSIMISISIYLYMEQKKKDNLIKSEQLEVLKYISENIVTEKNFTGLIQQLNELKLTSERLSQNQIAISDKLKEFKELYDSKAYSKTEQKIIIDNFSENIQNSIKTVNDLTSKLDIYHAEIVSIIKSISPKIVKSINNASNTEIKHIDEINKLVNVLHELPKEMLETLDQYTKKVDEYVKTIVPQIDNLSYDLNDLETKRKKDFDKIMKEIQTTNENYNIEISKKIEELSGEYAQFKSLTDKIINQMTKMAESDYEIMKGLIHE